jgi:hypothetical protein
MSGPDNTLFCAFDDDDNFEEMYNIEQVSHQEPGPNPTIVSYNASVVKIYNATTT